MLLRLSDEDENRIFGDFVWAIETLPETRSLANTALRPGGPPLDVVASVIRRRLDPLVRTSYSEAVSTGYGLVGLDPVEVALDPTFLRSSQAYAAYLDWLGVHGLSLKLDPEDLYRPRVDTMFAGDASPTGPGYLDTVTYRLMLASFLGTTFGLPTAWSLLRILLLRGSLNRQVAIMQFLRLLASAPADPDDYILPGKSDVVAVVRDWPSLESLVSDEFGLQLLDEYRNRWGQNLEFPAHV